MKSLVPSSERRVRGAISMASWHAPLESSTQPRETSTPAGYAYLLPPFAPSGFEGPRAEEAIDALRRGGCSAARAHVTRALATGSAVLLPHMAALEVAEWSFAKLATNEMASLAAESSREAMAIACARLGIAQPLSRVLLRGWVTALGTRLARWVVPFDIEVYLRVHFLKVRAQTWALIGEYLRDAPALGLRTRALQALRDRVAR
jgi:2-dehydropantoate 2-reductase